MSKDRQQKKLRRRLRQIHLPPKPALEPFSCFNCKKFARWGDPDNMDTPADAILCESCMTLPKAGVMDEHQAQADELRYSDQIAEGFVPGPNRTCVYCGGRLHRYDGGSKMVPPGALWCYCGCWICLTKLEWNAETLMYTCNHGKGTGLL